MKLLLWCIVLIVSVIAMNVSSYEIGYRIGMQKIVDEYAPSKAQADRLSEMLGTCGEQVKKSIALNNSLLADVKSATSIAKQCLTNRQQ